MDTPSPPFDQGSFTVEELQDWMDKIESIPGGERWTCEFQGKLFTLRRHSVCGRKGGGRRKSMGREFSRQARFRMLKMAARIDWQRVGPSLFVTLTYPYSDGDFSKETRNGHRKEFQRLTENYVGRHVPIVWRIEWMPRKSGADKGKVVPHFHLLLFGVQYIPHDDVRRMWACSLGWNGYVRTEVKRAGQGECAALYVAKYCAKVDPSSSLVNVAYLENHGRHYGYLRKSLIPLCPKGSSAYVTLDRVKRLRKMASGKMKWYDLRFDSGFTLLGEIAKSMGAIVEDFGLDADDPFVID